MDRNVGAALGAAVLFGLSTPLAKELVGEVPPLLLAGLLYLGSAWACCRCWEFASLRAVKRASPGREAQT